MKSTIKSPSTLQEAMALFADADACFDFAVSMRWANGKVSCPRCGSVEHSFIASRRIWYCKGCKRQFSIKVGTIFEDSPLGMNKWMLALWLLVNCKNGVSSCEVARHLGITQKTAWFMLHRLRLAMQSGSFKKMSGEVEVDETYIGGKARNMHKGKRRAKGTGGIGKAVVMGLLERHGEVRTQVVSEVKGRTLRPEVLKHVEPGTTLYTDELASYRGLEAEYAHKVINHAEAYAKGNVHTNGMENFWSLLKRGIKGTYVSVEPFHLFRYLDEQAFRFNNRLHKDDGERFIAAMRQVADRRLTFGQLTGKLDCPTGLN